MELITRFERTRLISARALQLSLGAPPLTKTTKSDTAYSIARAEFEKGVLPLAVLRRYPDGSTKKVSVG